MNDWPENRGGLPRWLVIALAAKLAVIVLVVAAVVWWANR